MVCAFLGGSGARAEEKVLDGDREASVRVEVVPDHPDWIYALGEPARFLVRLIARDHLVADAEISYRIGLENMPAEEKRQTLDSGEVTLEGGTLKEPGFIRCSVSAKVAGKKWQGMATVGFAPEQLQPTQQNPEDFDRYWAAEKAELAKVPMEPTLELIPEASRGSINVYHVSFRTWSRTPSDRFPGRIYGILCEPKAPGKYPAFFRPPASGIRPYWGQRALAEQGAITLEIGIHGIPVNQAQEVYEQLRTGALDGYPTFNLDDRQRYYFHRVHLGCVRAIDFLASRPNWDGKHLIAFGQSQGGMLSIATAALDSRVTAVAAMIPAYCDVTGYLHGRAGGWPHAFRSAEGGQRTPEKIATSAYYDTVNFGRRLRVPVLVALGFNDENCPPTSVYAAYNAITAPKEMLRFLEVGHTVPPEMDDPVRAWVMRQAGMTQE